MIRKKEPFFNFKENNIQLIDGEKKKKNSDINTILEEEDTSKSQSKSKTKNKERENKKERQDSREEKRNNKQKSLKKKIKPSQIKKKNKKN